MTIVAQTAQRLHSISAPWHTAVFAFRGFGMISTLAGSLAIALYMLAFALQARSLAQPRGPSRALLLGLTALAVATHGLAVALLLNTPAGLHLGLFRVAALLAFAMLALMLVLALKRPIQSLFFGLFPFASLCLLAAITMDSGFEPIHNPDTGFTLHVIVAILAYAVLALAVCQALGLGWLERQLRQHRAQALLGKLPPLQTMEQLLFELVWVGVALLTLAIASGWYFLDDLFEQRVVHHTLLSMGSWLVFAGLLVGRYRFGWRGRTAVRWTLSGFALLLLAYFGSKLVLEIILNG